MKRIESVNHVAAVLLLSAAGLIAAGGFWACGGGSKDSAADHGAGGAPASNPPASAGPATPAQTPPATTPPAEAPKAAPVTETQTKEPRKEPVKETPKEPQREAFVTKVVTIPAGTALHVCLQQELSTERDAAGQAFDATTKGDVVIEGAKVIPEGSTVKGQVTLSKRAPKVGGKAELALEVKQLITPDGKTHRLFAEPLQLEGESATSSDVQKVVGGTVGGAIIGGLLGGKKGAVKGAAGGAAVGGVWAVATRGNDIVLAPNQEMEFHLAREISVTANVPTQPLP